MIKNQNSKQYDLEDRSFNFARDIRHFIKSLPKDKLMYEDYIQLLRSSGSIGANYIEANEAISKKDFVHRIKISRKEAKESIYWLKLLEVEGELLIQRRNELITESTELMLILSSIMRKAENLV
jgi:four helix bundle protein